MPELNPNRPAPGSALERAPDTNVYAIEFAGVGNSRGVGACVACVTCGYT